MHIEFITLKSETTEQTMAFCTFIADDHAKSKLKEPIQASLLSFSKHGEVI